MLNNMFIMFDPNVKNWPINIMLTTMICLIPNKLMMNSNKFNLKLSFNESFQININNKSNLLFNYSIIWSFLLINLMNIIPMSFSLSVSMSLLLISLMLWMSTVLNSMNNKMIIMMSFTPHMTPMLMTTLINIIELNSTIFFIMSLTMRLMINMMMGHLIINMMNNFPLIMFYLMIEIMIIIIQTYVYFMLNLMNMNNFW